MITMTITAVFLALIIYTIYVYSKRWTSKLRHIPTIPGYPVVGSFPYLNFVYPHMSIDKWSKKLGPVMVIDGGSPHLDAVIVSSYEGIRKVRPFIAYLL